MLSFKHWQEDPTSYDWPMLRYVQFQNASQKQSWFDEFLSGQRDDLRVEEHSIVVLDLSRKLEIQNILMRDRGALGDEQVMRVQELWMRLHRRLFPEQKIVSRDFLRLSIKTFLRERPDLSFIHSESDAHILDWIEFAHPLFLHPQGEEIVQGWVDGGQEHLYLWWKISKAFFLTCLEKNWISSTWISSLLSDAPLDKLNAVWPRGLVVDVGAQVSQVEIDLLERFAQSQDVVVLMPAPEILKLFPSLDKLYGMLRDRHPNGKLNLATPAYPMKEDIHVHRLPTPLSEVKCVVALLRTELESGRKLNELAILSPQIERYWPSLRHHLEQEGIPFEKDVVTRLTSLLPIHQWLAKLNSMRDQLDFSELETFLAGEDWGWRSEVFQSLFRNITESHELSRLKAVETQVARTMRNIDLKSKLTLKDFLRSSLSVWRSSETDALVSGLQRFADSTPAGVILDFSDWMTYLQSTLHQIETRCSSGVVGGVRIGNLAMGEASQDRFRIYLGLHDSAFQGERVSFNGALELQKMFSELGFTLKHPEEVISDYDLHWQLTEAARTFHLLSSDYNFQGQPEMPHLKILEWKDQLSTDMPLTRWDELQKAYVPSSVPEEAPLAAAKLKNRQYKRLSATSIERFVQCPFIYTAAKDLRLLDEPEFDLDPDARSAGSLVHRLFERVSALPGFPDQVQMDLPAATEFVEAHREQQGESLLWSSQRKKYAKLLLRFLDYERQRKQDEPGWTILDREKEVKADFDLKELRWFPAEELVPEGRVRFEGRIDRIDGRADGAFWLFDYKSSKKDDYSFKKWMDSGQVQLLVYSTILEDLREGPYQKISGASYYSYRPLNARLGFRVDEGGKTLTSEQWNEASQQARALIRDSILRMNQGEYLPKPIHPDRCKHCNWKGICRAQHLD